MKIYEFISILTIIKIDWHCCNFVFKSSELENPLIEITFLPENEGILHLTAAFAVNGIMLVKVSVINPSAVNFLNSFASFELLHLCYVYVTFI